MERPQGGHRGKSSTGPDGGGGLADAAIQVGRYRVVVSAASRESTALSASPFADFTVRRKPVVESQRILPVAFGVPLLLGGLMLWRHRRVST